MATGKEDVYPSECKELREKLKAAVNTRKTTRRDKVRLAIQRDTMGALSILAEFARCGLKSADIPPFTDPRGPLFSIYYQHMKDLLRKTISIKIKWTWSVIAWNQIIYMKYLPNAYIITWKSIVVELKIKNQTKSSCKIWHSWPLFLS